MIKLHGSSEEKIEKMGKKTKAKLRIEIFISAWMLKRKVKAQRDRNQCGSRKNMVVIM